MTKILPFCPCGSGLTYSECCRPYLAKLSLEEIEDHLVEDTILLEWISLFSKEIETTFIRKAKSHLFRISVYLDAVAGLYLVQGHPDSTESGRISEDLFYIKHNCHLSILGSTSLLAQGLFVQSGILLRTAMEDLFVFFELATDRLALAKFRNSNYFADDVLKRIGKDVPLDVRKWYGYFSKFFTHFGPYHSASYMPRSCFPDNFVIVTGLQNIVRVIVAFHIILERVYLDQTSRAFFWKSEAGSNQIVFDEDSVIFQWASELGASVNSDFPIDLSENSRTQ